MELLTGRRQVRVTACRTAVDFAEQVRRQVEEVYLQDVRIVLIIDNLNTHTTAMLDERFPPVRARRIVAKFERHYTPEFCSWVNIAEIELSALSR